MNERKKNDNNSILDWYTSTPIKSKWIRIRSMCPTIYVHTRAQNESHKNIDMCYSAYIAHFQIVELERKLLFFIHITCDPNYIHIFYIENIYKIRTAFVLLYCMSSTVIVVQMRLAYVFDGTF